MPRRDGTGPYNGKNGRRMNECRRDGGVRNRRRNPSDCRRYNDYLDNDEVTLKNQAQYYEEELKRINSRLDHLNTKSISS